MLEPNLRSQFMYNLQADLFETDIQLLKYDQSLIDIVFGMYVAEKNRFILRLKLEYAFTASANENLEHKAQGNTLYYTTNGTRTASSNTAYVQFTICSL